MPRSRVPLVAVIAAAACYGCAASEPSPASAPPSGGYRKAVQTMCDVDRRAALSPDEGPIELGQKRSAWINEHVDDPDGIYFRTMLSVKGPDEQSKMLRDEARKLGLAGCALADSLQKDGSGGISP